MFYSAKSGANGHEMADKGLIVTNRPKIRAHHRPSIRSSI